MLRSYQFRSRIDNLFVVAERLQDDEAKAALSRHLCVLTSGYIEISIKEILLDYASGKAVQNIQVFLEASLKNITNMNTPKICEQLARFSTDWMHRFENELSDEQKDAIDTTVRNRNLIAHGKDVGISLVQARTYYKKIKEVIENIRKTIET